MYKLGIDVGGTHIDYALLDKQNCLVASYKQLASGELITTLIRGLQELSLTSGLVLSDLAVIHLGTTLAMNSLLELKSLYKVGLLRLAGHTPDFPPAYFWPEVYRKTILASYRTLGGGREYNKHCVQALHSEKLFQAVTELLTEGAESLAIVGVFSPLYADDEELAAELIRSKWPTIPLSLSFQLGSLGFIERENTTLINAALKKVLRKNFNLLRNRLADMGWQGELLLTQNNGTLFTVDEALEFPVKTIASGPTNSLIGACKLANCQNAVVVDIGGTSTDLGQVENGFPLYSLRGTSIAGIACHLLAPELTALAMGGGSVIRRRQSTYSIGPDSVGASLFKQCQSRGGPNLTLYDVGQSLKTKNNSEARLIMTLFMNKIKEALQLLIPNPSKQIILFVGGGSENIPENLLENNYIRPPHYQIANAYGAALAEVAGQVDCLIAGEPGKKPCLQALEEKAKALAVQKGAAADSLRIIEKKILPLYYMQKPLYRVLITVAGSKLAMI